jgi:hypothetical protein
LTKHENISPTLYGSQGQSRKKGQHSKVGSSLISVEYTRKSVIKQSELRSTTVLFWIRLARSRRGEDLLAKVSHFGEEFFPTSNIRSIWRGFSECWWYAIQSGVETPQNARRF